MVTTLFCGNNRLGDFFGRGRDRRRYVGGERVERGRCEGGVRVARGDMRAVCVRSESGVTVRMGSLKTDLWWMRAGEGGFSEVLW